MEFFERQDAFNVFDYLWPNDIISISSTCTAIRKTVNSYYCTKVEMLPSSSSSSDDKYPPVCRYFRWWLRHCLHCKNEMQISDCLDISDISFKPEALKPYTFIPICSKNCVYDWPYLKKITKTEAIKRYSLNEKELSELRHVKKQNPHYRNAAPMKLFFVSEVQLAAMAKFKLASCGKLEQYLNQRRERATRTEQMRRNKQLGKDERKNELKTELEKQGLELRSDSQIAEWYIDNSKRALPLSQSVQLIRRAHIVHQHVGKYYHEKLDIAYTQLKEDYFNDHDHESWTDKWQETKLATEGDALGFFAKAKKNLSEMRKCQCGEPLFLTEELNKFEKKLENQLNRKKKSRKS